MHVRLYAKDIYIYIENVSPWIKIKQKNLEIYINHVPFTSLRAYISCKEMYKIMGVVTVYFHPESPYPDR